MITVDASALLAIILKEPEEEAILTTLAIAGGAVISPVNWCGVAVRARAVKQERGLTEMEAMAKRLKIRIAPTDEMQTRAAFDAHIRFGRGTPASLNLGGCFAYALAAREGDGLLFKGDDFPKTDVRSALS